MCWNRRSRWQFTSFTCKTPRYSPSFLRSMVPMLSGNFATVSMPFLPCPSFLALASVPLLPRSRVPLLPRSRVPLLPRSRVVYSGALLIVCPSEQLCALGAPGGFLTSGVRACGNRRRMYFSCTGRFQLWFRVGTGEVLSLSPKVEHADCDPYRCLLPHEA